MREETHTRQHNGYLGNEISQGYASNLRRFRWDFLGTLTFQWNLSIAAIRRAVERHLARLSPLLAFWVIERGKVDAKDHVHILYNFDESTLNGVTKSRIARDWFRRNGIAEVAAYDSSLDGCAYVCKALGTNPADYDLWVFEDENLSDLGRDERQVLESGRESISGLIGGKTDEPPGQAC